MSALKTPNHGINYLSDLAQSSESEAVEYAMGAANLQLEQKPEFLRKDFHAETALLCVKVGQTYDSRFTLAVRSVQVAPLQNGAHHPVCVVARNSSAAFLPVSSQLWHPGCVGHHNIDESALAFLRLCLPPLRCARRAASSPPVSAVFQLQSLGPKRVHRDGYISGTCWTSRPVGRTACQ